MKCVGIEPYRNAERIRLDCARNEPQSEPFVGQARWSSYIEKNFLALGDQIRRWSSRKGGSHTAMFCEKESGAVSCCFALIYGNFRTQVSWLGRNRLLCASMSWFPFTYPCLRFVYCRNGAAMAGGRAIMVAVITMAAPQTRQMIAGRCFSLRTRVRQGATRSTRCRRRSSFLLHAWR